MQKEGDLKLQGFEPRSAVSLPDMLDMIPHLRSLFDTVDFQEMDRLTRTYSKPPTPADIEETVRFFMRLSVMADKPIPELIDRLSGNIRSLYLNYAAKRGEFNAAFRPLGALAGSQNATFNRLANFAARVVAALGNDANTYPAAAGLSFPSAAIFADCSANNTLVGSVRSQILADTNPANAGRKDLIENYVMLRAVACATRNTDKRLNEDPGEVLHGYFIADHADHPDPEADLERAIQDVLTHIAASKSLDEKIADWLAKKPNLIAFTDSLMTDGANLAQNPALYPQLQRVADLVPGFAGIKNNAGTYLLRDALDSLDTPISQLPQIDSVIASALDLNNWPVFQFGTELLNDWHAALAAYGNGNQATGRNKLMALFWDGGISKQYRMNYLSSSITDLGSDRFKNLSGMKNWCPGGVISFYYSAGAHVAGVKNDWNYSIDQSQCNVRNTANPFFLSGLLYNNGSGEPIQTHTGLAHLRAQANDMLGNANGNFADDANPLVTPVGPGLNFRLSYDGETQGQSFTDNLLLHLYSGLYHVPSRTYGLTENEAIEKFSNFRRSVTNLLAQLQYSMRNLGVLDHAGLEPGWPGFSSVPLLTGFIFGNAKAYVDPYFQDGNPAGPGKSPQFRMAVAVRANNALFKDSHWLADPGNKGWSASGDDATAVLGLTGKTEIPMFCTGTSCETPRGSRRNTPRRNGIEWIPNLSMFPAELLTPGKFIPRSGGVSDDAEYLHQAWSGGSLSPQQGDIENALFNMGGVVSSLVAMNAWQGHGPFTFRGRAPNGSALKYKNTYHTDAYGSELRMKVRMGLGIAATGDETIYVAMGNNTGEHKGEVLVTPENRCSLLAAVEDYAFNDNVMEVRAGLDPATWLIRRGEQTWQQYNIGAVALENRFWKTNHWSGWGLGGCVHGQCDLNACYDGDGNRVAEADHTTGSCDVVVVIACWPIVCNPAGCYPWRKAWASDRRYGGRRSGNSNIEFWGINEGNATLGLNVGGNNGLGYVDSSLEIREKIYIPANGGPCWAEASAGYGYARYGFIRRSNDEHYADDSHCPNWEAIQVDFDTREEAIQANLSWLLNEKKFTMILPNAGADMTAAVTSGSSFQSSAEIVSLAAWVINQANGLIGLMHLRPVASDAMTNITNTTIARQRAYNGAWNFFSPQCPAGKSGCSMCDPNAVTGNFLGHPVYEKCAFGTRYSGGLRDMVDSGGGRIPNGSGLRDAGTDPDGHMTHRFRATSFERGDSSVSLLYTAVKTGLVTAVTTEELILDSLLSSLGIVQAASPLDLKTSEPLLALLNNTYTWNQIVTADTGYSTSAATFRKFRGFYEKYITTDDFHADGSLGSDGSRDLWQKYLVSETYPGCVDGTGARIYFCLTAAEMPPLPRAPGVTYPASYDAQGAVASWAPYTGAADAKFGPLLTALVIMMGTELDSRTPYIGPKNAACSFSGGVASQTLNSNGTCRYLNPGENRDAVSLKGYLRRKYLSRSAIENNMPDFPLSILNETLLDEATNNTPAYNSSALLNLLVESSPGARNGLLTKLGSSMYLHPQSLYYHILDNLNGRLEILLTNLGIIGGNPSTVQKLAYFATKNVVGAGKPFAANKIENLGGEPAKLVSEILNLVRTVTASAAGRDSFCALITNAGRAADELKVASFPAFSPDNCIKLVALLHAQNGGNYVVDEALLAFSVNLFYSGKIDIENVLRRITAATSAMKTAFDNLNTAVVQIYGESHDLRKIILYGTVIPEPFADTNNNGVWDSGEPYLDFNGNGDHDKGADLDLGRILGSGSYPVPVVEITNTHGTISLIRSLPDFMASSAGLSGIDFRAILNNMLLFGKTKGLETPPAPLQRSDITGALDTLETYRNGNWYANLIGDKFAADLDQPGKIQEPALRDFSRDGQIDAGEFSDYNGNGVRDKISVRQYLTGFAAEYHTGVVARQSDDTLSRALSVAENVLSPKCGSYMGYPSCGITNAGYMTPDLLGALRDIYATPAVTGENLVALKNLTGAVFYDSGTNAYSYLLTNFKEGMLPIQEISKGSRAYSSRQNIEAFAPTGSLRYLANNISNSKQHASWLFNDDAYSLFNLKAFREYGKPETLWGVASGLLTDFSKKAYSQTGQSFHLSGDYYMRFRGIFR